MELLRLERIYFQYDEENTALKDVSVSIAKGERIAVLGGNGAGKSTFFLCCNGVLKPKSGSVFLKGRKASRSKKDLIMLRQAVGLVFQDPDSQIIAGTVKDEVSFGPMNLRLGSEEVEKRVTEALMQMNLAGYQNRAPHYLSGGEKRRVGIADILAMQPDIILLDEPTASLDPENVGILEKVLDELSALGITIVVSTHDVNFAFRFAQRGIVFKNGKIVMDATIEDIFASSSTLSSTGLEKPLLYAAAEALEAKFPALKSCPKPKNMNDFQNIICKLEQIGKC